MRSKGSPADGGQGCGCAIMRMTSTEEMVCGVSETYVGRQGVRRFEEYWYHGISVECSMTIHTACGIMLPRRMHPTLL